MTKTLTPDKAGRVKLPKEVLERLAADPKLKMRWRTLDDRQLIFEIGHDPRDLRGIIKDRGIHPTVEEIGEAIKQQGSESQ